MPDVPRGSGFGASTGGDGIDSGTVPNRVAGANGKGRGGKLRVYPKENSATGRLGSHALPGLISGLGGKLRDLFKDRDDVVHTETPPPSPRDVQPFYRFDEKLDKRILNMADYYYREGSFEKIQFARKWMRNILIFQGYHELEWSEINVAWDIILHDSGDYAFPNNYYRSLIQHGVRAYVQNAPLIEPVPASDDPEAEAASKAARTALEIIKAAVHYDMIRTKEAYNLRLCGNSFRFSYFSKDPRYGFTTAPVFKDASSVLSPSGSMCPNCGPLEGGFQVCPQCNSPVTPIAPIVAQVANQIGTVKYPKGEIVTEVVHPLEVYIRSSSYDIWHAPFIIRNRVVDRLSLQAAYPDIQLAPRGDEGGGEAYSTGGDLGLIYLQSLADLPGDPTQYAAWYERATAAAKVLLVECWLRPSTYFFDKELITKFPDGMYIAKTGDTLLEARNASLDDHWTHYVYTPVAGRIWGDGDDDVIPGQLKLDEVDRLILRNQGYNSAPLLVIDSQRIDKNVILNDPSTIIEARPAGRPIRDAFAQITSQPLSNDTWMWREAQKFDMSFHARISPASAGRHEKGVNTFGGQESAAAKSDAAVAAQLMLWKTADEQWARQVLKLYAENCPEERVHAVMGINGRYEFDKLRGSALDQDKFVINTRVLPVDPQMQESLGQAVAAGLLNPQDPRVMRKALEVFHLPTELDTFYTDSKVQWEEIEKIKSTGQQILPRLIRDNDQVHIEVCRLWLNSDEGMQMEQANPALYEMIMQHAQLHIMNMARQAQMQQVIQMAAGGGQPQQGQPEQGGPKKPSGGGEKQEKGGQVPKNPVTRQQRAEKGQAAKPHRPQPSSGNQYHQQRLT